MKRADRLSALIQRFRIQAKVHAPGETRKPTGAWDATVPNLFILRRGRLRFDAAAIPDLDADGNSLAFLPRGAPKGLLFQAEPADAEFVCATVDTGGEANPIGRALPDLISVSLTQSPALRAVTDILLEEALAPRCGGGAVIDRLCEVVVIRLLRGAIEAGQTQSGLLAGLAHPRLSLAIVAMHDNPERAWRLEDLAATAGMSRTHFATSFRSVVGVTPGDYLSGWRLTLARMEIAKGTPLKVVAGHVGFSGPAALSRAYARRYGVSPRQRRAAERPALMS
jgi:AraC-like DNA-binding protein